MRNLKRVLSLALALVMVLGMMVITTSAADFTDAEEIKYTEAVEVMTAIGVINGMGDGSFAPKATLTREQAAKILAYVTLGAEADNYLAGSTAPFADVAATKWSAKYVAYCKNLGIINGVGDNKFNPAGTLKVVEFAKMLLVAAGIDGNYTGAGWENAVKTAVAKTEMKNTGIKITTAEITREEACELALAAMKSGGSTVRYYDVVVGGEVAATFTDITDAYVMSNVVGGTVEPWTDTVGSLLWETHKVRYIADDADAFANPGVGYEKVVKGKKVIDLFYGEEATLTYTANMNTVAGKKAIVADLKALEVELTARDGGDFLFKPYGRATIDNVEQTGSAYCGTVNQLAALTSPNAVVKVYVEEGAVTLITVENTHAGVVSDVVEADVENEVPAYIVVAGKAFVTDKFEENDVVLYTISAGEIQTVAKAEGFTGTLSGYTKDNKFTIGEKVYQLSDIALCDNDAIKAAAGKEMVYSVDAAGKLIAVAAPGKAPEVEVVLSDYAIVLDAKGFVKTTAATWPATTASVEVSAKVQVMLADGTVEVWDLAILKAEKAIANTEIAKGDYYYMLGKTPVEVAFAGENDGDKAAALTADIKADFSGIYTYADKALVAAVASSVEDLTKDAVFQYVNEDAITKTSYLIAGNELILNDKTVFVLKELKADGSFKGYTVKTGIAALEDTSIAIGAADIIVAYAPTLDEEGAVESYTCTATLVIAETTAFDATEDPVVPTEAFVFVDENYAVSFVGTDEIHTYNVVYTDGKAGTIAVKVVDGYTELATGVYVLNSDGGIGAPAALTAKEVKLVSGTTVIFTDNTAYTTTAKTVVVGGELAAEVEAYVLVNGTAIALAFIAE